MYESIRRRNINRETVIGMLLGVGKEDGAEDEIRK